MKIATWSVNGVNRRLPYLLHWLQRRQPDLVALQKIRVSAHRRDSFPRRAIEEVGYRVEALLADRELASVAVLARQGFLGDGRWLDVLHRGLPAETDGQFLMVAAGPVRIASVYAPYAPSGHRTRDQVRRSIQAKAAWLHGLKRCIAEHRIAERPGTPKLMFLCGDFNVVLDGESQPDTLNRSPEEREALTSLCASGFADLYRDFHRDGRQGFNSGTPATRSPDTRLHLVLGPSSLVPRIELAKVDLDYRAPIDDLPGEKWAPGAPVVVHVAGDSTPTPSSG